MDRRTTKIGWDSMKRKFGGNQKGKKSLLNVLRREFEILEMKMKSLLNALRREFEILEMKNDESITDYFVMIISNKMRRN